MLGSYKWSALKVSSTAAGILISFGSLWFVNPSTQLVGRQLAIFHSLETVYFGRAYDVLMVNCDTITQKSNTFNDGKWHVSGKLPGYITNGQISALFPDIADFHPSQFGCHFPVMSPTCVSRLLYVF